MQQSTEVGKRWRSPALLIGNPDVGRPGRLVERGVPDVIGALTQVHHMQQSIAREYGRCSLALLTGNPDVGRPTVPVGPGVPDVVGAVTQVHHMQLRPLQPAISQGWRSLALLIGNQDVGCPCHRSSCDLLGGINRSWSCRLAEQRSGSPLVIHGSEVHAKFSDGRVSFDSARFSVPTRGLASVPGRPAGTRAVCRT